MFIQPIPSGPFETNAYVVACTDTSEALIIDPAPESAATVAACLSANLLRPTCILLTHSHWDHIADTAKLKQLLKVPVFVHEDDAENLSHPGSDGLPCWIAIEGVLPDGFFREGHLLTCGKLKFQVIHTPGHTPGGVCFYEAHEHVLISGDTLFKGSIGNLSFPTARPALMWPSLDKLAKLPPETVVYPGHGPKTTIKAESWLPEAQRIFGHSI